ncbi:MAG: hypothetical protein RQ748_12690 [Elusimicrobiales bacterium]|nr:hypothetical protein [Elusimicrobiales bacterium]
MTRTALLTLSILLLVGVYGLYWAEGRRSGHPSTDPPVKHKGAGRGAAG